MFNIDRRGQLSTFFYLQQISQRAPDTIIADLQANRLHMSTQYFEGNIFCRTLVIYLFHLCCIVGMQP